MANAQRRSKRHHMLALMVIDLLLQHARKAIAAVPSTAARSDTLHESRIHRRVHYKDRSTCSGCMICVKRRLIDWYMYEHGADQSSCYGNVEGMRSKCLTGTRAVAVVPRHNRMAVAMSRRPGRLCYKKALRHLAKRLTIVCCAVTKEVN